MSEMGRCRDCKWWAGDVDTDGIGWGRCEMTGNNGYGFTGGSLAHDETLAYADDGTDYRGWLHTEASFGCVQFEPRDPATE